MEKGLDGRPVDGVLMADYDEECGLLEVEANKVKKRSAWRSGTSPDGRSVSQTRSVDFGVTLALTEMLALSDETPVGSPSELTPVMLSPDLDARSMILMTWRDRAACLSLDPELFFPIGNTGPALLQTEEAKAVCRRCEVVESCLSWAMESGQDAGVWGGLSEDERRALKRRDARARRADPVAPIL
jgi:WhiB family transcriptional regulator, redox-sensing transcriptional regulator